MNKIETYNFSGDEETYTTINNAAAVDAGYTDIGHLTTIPSTDHGFKAGTHIYIQGSVAYNGLKKIQAVAANTITIYQKYVAETFAGTETLKSMVGFDEPFELIGFQFHLSAAGGAGSFIATLDANAGAAFDVVMHTTDMTAATDVEEWGDPTGVCPRYFVGGDKIDFTFPNANNKLYGLTVHIRKTS